MTAIIKNKIMMTGYVKDHFIFDFNSCHFLNSTHKFVRELTKVQDFSQDSIIEYSEAQKAWGSFFMDLLKGSQDNIKVCNSSITSRKNQFFILFLTDSSAFVKVTHQSIITAKYS